MREGFAIWAILALASGETAAQPTIEHQGLNCIPRETFTQYLAQIAPPGTIRSAKLYFRAAMYNDFYFVDMVPTDSGFGGTLPLPSAETSGIVYYIEAVDETFQTARSEEFRVDVGDGSCSPGPGALLFAGAPPGIIVGATQASMSALPLGFQATGITGFISAAGVTAGAASSGIGAGVAIGAAAGAAAGVGVVVATNGGESGEGGTENNVPGPTGSDPPPGEGGSGPPTPTPPTPPNPPSPTPPSPTPPTPPEPPPPTPTPPPPGPTPPGPPPPPPPPPPPDPPTACFSWTAMKGTCRVHFDASCSNVPAGGGAYAWRMLGPPVAEPPAAQSFDFDFAGDPRCLNDNDFSRPVRLTVTDSEGQSDSVQQNVTVQPGATFRSFDRDENAGALSITSRILTPAGEAAGGWLTVNGVLVSISSGAAAELELRRASDGVTIEATMTSPGPEGTLWEVTFSESGSGIYAIERGAVVVTERRRLVFRLSGAAGEVIRFRRR